MMKIKMNLIVAVMITFCFTASIFMIIPLHAANKPYDPWLDYDDNGFIGLPELTKIAGSYNTFGTPVNKTALLYNVNDTFTSLLSQIGIMNTTIAQLQNSFSLLNATLIVQQLQINQMNATISQLSSSVDILNMTKLGKPDYDSGWNNITAGQQITFNHNLGTTNVLVYMIGNDTSGTLYIHQIKYGMDDNFGYEYGARWQELTSTSIKVIRGASDPNWNQIRIMIWKIPT